MKFQPGNQMQKRRRHQRGTIRTRVRTLEEMVDPSRVEQFLLDQFAHAEDDNPEAVRFVLSQMPKQFRQTMLPPEIVKLDSMASCMIAAKQLADMLAGQQISVEQFTQHLAAVERLMGVYTAGVAGMAKEIDDEAARQAGVELGPDGQPVEDATIIPNGGSTH